MVKQQFHQDLHETILPLPSLANVAVSNGIVSFSVMLSEAFRGHAGGINQLRTDGGAFILRRVQTKRKQGDV